MNFQTLVRPVNEIFPLLGIAYSPAPLFFFVPFAPVSYLGLGA